jgi:hypothetical protein
LVVPGGVEDELAEEFAGGGVDDFDVEVLDEDQDAGSVVDAADADVVQSAAPANAAGDLFISLSVGNGFDYKAGMAVNADQGAASTAAIPTARTLAAATA